jgi:hypothetical protein
MQQYFPPDVSLRIFGDRDQAQGLLGAARTLLFKALLMQSSGGNQPVGLVQRISDGTQIEVKLVGNQKIVSITAAPPEQLANTRGPLPEPEQPPPAEYAATMLSGVVRQGYLQPIGDGKMQLDGFRPTANCARAYGFDKTYNPSTRLAVPSYFGGANNISQYRYVKPSMYSGAMKRVAEAIFGLGVITDSSPEYLTGKPPKKFRRAVQLKYDWKWNKTHGIVRAAQQNHWLVEVSNTNGVLAMPLPLFRNTTTASYRERMLGRGDLDTVRVLDEFGGLPSGENFPTTPDGVAAAIAAGKVLRLMTVDELAPVYGLASDAVASTPWAENGWAFSDDGSEARVVTERYPPTGAHPNWYGFPVLYLYSLRFRLSQHQRGLPLVGHVELALLHQGTVTNGTWGGSGLVPLLTGAGVAGLIAGTRTDDCHVTTADDFSQTPRVVPSVVLPFPEMGFAARDAAVVNAFFNVNEGIILNRGGLNPNGTDTLQWVMRPLGIPSSGFDFQMPLFPAFCREGVMFLSDVAVGLNLGATTGKPSRVQQGIFGGIGVVRFDDLRTDVLSVGITADPLNWYLLPPFSEEARVGAVVNAGPTRAYVMTNGIQFPNGATSFTTNYSRYYGYDLPIYQLSVAGGEYVFEGYDLDLAGASPTDICFIGSV